jgi:hypothetical protein
MDWPLYPHEASANIWMLAKPIFLLLKLQALLIVPKLCARTASDMTVLKLHLIATSYSPATP